MPPLRRPLTSSTQGSSYTTSTCTIQGSSYPTSTYTRHTESSKTIFRARQRPSTGVSTTICALTESRGVSATIGLCFLNISTGECVLSEICDTQQYVRTLQKLQVFSPTEILLPETALIPEPSKLVLVVREHFPGAYTRKTPRKHYDEHTGHCYIQTLAFKEDIEAIKIAISAKYYAMSAAAAAFKFIEFQNGITFAPNSLRIKYEASEGSMLIDFSTVHNLELIQNIQNSQSADSLFGLLNHTLTPMGARLLRSNILQPIMDVVILNGRLDAVEELTRNEEMFFALRCALKPFLDMDRLLTALVTMPVKPTLKLSEQAINNVIILKQALACVTPVIEALAGARSELLVNIKEVCDTEAISTVQRMINEVINEDVVWAKSPLELRNQRCHAVKGGVNGLLDVARKAFKEFSDDVEQMLQGLTGEHNLDLELRFESGRGYYFRLPAIGLDVRQLPSTFVNVVERKKRVEFTTLDLIKLNAKLNESLTETLILSDEAVQTLTAKIRQEVGPLYKITEGIALIDMVASFCQLGTVQDYVRPEFTNTLAIKSGRHPLREKIHKTRFIPNDVYASTESRFQIMTGCNMSGKSTYIRSIALMSVTAQIGSFVPAQFASLPIINRLFARVSMNDGIESNASTFALEMRETAFILHNVCEGSMVIMDELGRGTSTTDGLAIALSVCEDLVKSKAFVWFATHFRDLAVALGEKAGVVSLHMQVEVSEQQKITMLYKVADGTAKEEHYGLALAKLMDMPEDVLDRATVVSEALARNLEQARERCSEYLVARRRRAVLGLKETLTQAYNGRMDDDALRSFLAQLQCEFVAQMQAFEIDEEPDEEGWECMSELADSEEGYM